VISASLFSEVNEDSVGLGPAVVRICHAFVEGTSDPSSAGEAPPGDLPRRRYKALRWYSRNAKLIAVLLALPLCGAQDAEESSAYQNPELAAEARAADLVSRMTLQEKVLQMQNASPAIPRLGIPAYDWWNEALHGVARAGRATVFPQAIGLSASWDTNLMHRVAETISTEARAKYNQAIRENDHSRYHGLTFWSPNINIFRDPRWGRGQETYGEDPFLTSQMAIAFIQGMQGDDRHYFKTVATPKHLAVHSGPESLRHSFDARPSARDLEETYLPAFKASIVEGKAGSIMCSYNRLNGIPACANSDLLQKHLRNGWGFGGYVVSDCGAVYDILHGHKYAQNAAEAAAAAVEAGTDLTCGDEYGVLGDAVQRNLISEAEINRALIRLFAARFRLGMFDTPDRVPYASISDNDTAAHRQLALQAARESMVLLSNRNSVLPLGPNVHSIAVIGPASNDPDTLLANYHGTPSAFVTPLEGIRRKMGGRNRIRFALGSTFTSVSNALVGPEVLAPPESAVAGQKGRGLLAEYFANPDFSGRPAFSRLEPRVYLQRQMEHQEIESRIPRNGYSVRWVGTLRAPYSGTYKLGLVRVRCEECQADDHARLFLNDKLILDADTKSSALRDGKSVDVQLRRGQIYPLRIEYRQHSGGVGVQLVWTPPAATLLAEAVNVAQSADVTVAFVGLNSELEGEELPLKIPGFSGGDRTSLDLPAPQLKLLAAISRTGKPLIVVLMSGSALALGPVGHRVSALLEAWYGGEEAGTAIAEILTGDQNPAGRLPLTFYRSVHDLPAFEDYTMQGRTYRYFRGKPLYPFGYGLSYASFQYSDLEIAPRTEKSRVHVSALVKNLSAREGDEVVQLYVSKGLPSEDDPIRELRGFQRIHLGARQAQRVGFDLDAEDLNHGKGTSAGSWKISIGGGQPIGDTPRVESRY
jgi:beta-glucosidase